MDIETYLKLLVIKAVWSCQREFFLKIDQWKNSRCQLGRASSTGAREEVFLVCWWLLAIFSVPQHVDASPISTFDFAWHPY